MSFSEKGYYVRRFTILELLMVIAVIVILASMLLPGLKKAKENVDQKACMSNLKQFGIAVYMYASDYNDWLPPSPSSTTGYWTVMLKTYLGNSYPNKKTVWTCPIAFNEHNYNQTYAINAQILDWGFKKLTSFQNPSKGFIFTSSFWSTSFYSMHVSPSQPPVRFFHHGGLNYLFIDAHVTWVKHSDLTTEMWNGN